VVWVVLLAVCWPWIVAILWYGRQLRRDGAVPLSAGEAVRRRLGIR
jgi:hypothetical protein